MKDYYTIEETEKGINGFLPIPRTTQSKYRKDGLLVFIKVGRQIYYRTEHLKDLFIKLEQPAINKAD
ncbi:MAG TPA: DNA-binding protein [Epsilonproteobacteria bacterium]|nr:DNA-binding protein [Campylobacterota bacterium]